MKKIFTLIAAALMAVGANAQTTENLKLGGNAWNVNFPLMENVLLTAKGGYAEYKLTTDLPFKAADYQGFRVEYSGINGTANEWGTIMQIVISSAETHLGKDWQGNDAQVPNLVDYQALDPEAEEYVGNFDKFVETDDDATTCPTIGGFTLQAVSSGNSIFLKKVFLIKKDGTEIQTTFAGDAWGGGGYDVVAKSEGFPPMEFIGQYGGQQIQLEDGTAASWSQETEGEGEVQKYTIEFAQPIGCDVVIEFQNAGSGFMWMNFPKGTEKIEFTLDKTTSLKKANDEDPGVVTDVTEIWIKAASGDASDYPAIATVKSMERVLTTAEELAVKNILVEKNNGAIFNLAGQQVSKAVKGVYIQNGKKFVVK